jgi:DNA polymerase
MSQALRRLARDLRIHAEELAFGGVREIPAAEADGARPETPGATHSSAGAQFITGRAEGESAADLAGLAVELSDCRRCRLAAGRTQIVFGTGNPRARLIFVGEGPGQEEDRQGIPFVGPAGALLTDIIEKGMKLARSDVYICNVVKCRPPDNRNPEPDEVEACAPFLARQIELVSPEVLVTLGNFATQALLGTSESITRLRGRWFEYRGIPLMPTFHPAHLLRHPAYKRQVWEDIQQVMHRLGLLR